MFQNKIKSIFLQCNSYYLRNVSNSEKKLLKKIENPERLWEQMLNFKFLLLNVLDLNSKINFYL